MLSPQDIKTKTFTRSIRGYNPDEVDKYIDLLCEKYEEIFRENRELEYKVKTLTEQLADVSGTKEIKQTLGLAQQAADKIVNDAQKKSDAIYASAQKNTQAVLAEFRAEIAKEAKAYTDLELCVSELKESIFRTYRESLERIKDISPKAEHAELLKKSDTAAYINKVMKSIENDMSEYEQLKMDVETAPSVPMKNSHDAIPKQVRVKDTIKQINKKIISGDKKNGTANE